ncbi:MAG TPA: hypothetical protein VGC42_10980 [Kofleriaceae bacterium]
MNVDDLVGALRATDGEDPELADATRLRVQRSLASNTRTQHRLAGVLAALGILCGGTVSWALATGKLAAMWAPVPVRIEAPVPPVRVAQVPPVRVAQGMPVPETPAIAAPVIAPVPEAPVAAPVPVVPARVAPPRPRPVAPPQDEALYRRAHELHFHGGDPAAAVAAWDAYLAAEPSGRFAVDARYDRALMLIRLRRYAEARAALAAFAAGEVEPAGYHQADAEQLLARLARVR